MNDVEVYVLDVGQEQYGDSILICGAGKVILVDGGNLSSCRDKDGYTSVPSQIRNILELDGDAAIHVNLLVVTHCHSDHIGCLPDLVSSGKLKAEHALVADERLGFGLDEGDQPPATFQQASATLQNVLYALFEEAPSKDEVGNNGQLAAFIDAAGGLKGRYMDMLATLEKHGTTVVRFGRDSRDLVQALIQNYSGLQLDILGPTDQHLKICANYIRDSLEQHAKTYPQTELLAISAVDLYRQLHNDTANALDGSARGHIDSASRNNQSILLACGPKGRRVFLAGDMQFHQASTPGLQDAMHILWQAVQSHAPFSMVKTAHHTASNGLRLKELQSILKIGGVAVHSGGMDDPEHPSPVVLREFKQAQPPPTFDFYRTDRNGQVHVTGGQVETAKGSKNDYTVNVDPKKRPTH